MKIGEHMEPVIELLEELNGNDTDAKLKLLALVISEYMLNADVTGFEVSAGRMKVAVDISGEIRMTTITREQLHERARRKVKELEFAITQSAFTSIRDGLNEELELARIALASLDAEPVGVFHIEDQQVSGTTDYIKDGEWPIDNGVIEVYAASPAPVVPEKMNFSTACNFVQINGMAKEDRATLAMRAWNACRTDMLNGGKS